MSAPSSAPTTSKAAPATRWALRVTVSVLALLFVAQGLTGGEYLVGNEAVMGLLHGPGAIAVHIVSGLQLVIAAVLRGVAGGPLWPTALSALVFGVSFGQAALGAGDTLDYHIPLAMLLLIAVTAVLGWAWASAPPSGSMATDESRRKANG